MYIYKETLLKTLYLDPLLWRPNIYIYILLRLYIYIILDYFENNG